MKQYKKLKVVHTHFVTLYAHCTNSCCQKSILLHTGSRSHRLTWGSCLFIGDANLFPRSGGLLTSPSGKCLQQTLICNLTSLSRISNISNQMQCLVQSLRKWWKDTLGSLACLFPPPKLHRSYFYAVTTVYLHCSNSYGQLHHVAHNGLRLIMVAIVSCTCFHTFFLHASNGKVEGRVHIYS